MSMSLNYSTVDHMKRLLEKAVSESTNPHFENEARCKTFLVIMIHLCEKKTFRPNSLALSLALKWRLWATRKWPILVVGERMFYYKLSDSCFTEIVLQVL